MFYRKISNDIKMSLTIPQYATNIFNLIEKNQDWLKQWLSWPDNITSVTDVENFIKIELLKFQQNTGLHTTIFYQNKIAGVLGFNDIHNGIARAGCWLSREHNGKGIMTRCLKELIHQGFSNYAIDKIEIHCADENLSSQRISARLNFKQTGQILNADNIGGIFVDHVIYQLEKESFYAYFKKKQYSELCV